LGICSRRRTNGCDQAQSEHFQFADAVVGKSILRAVSVIRSTHSTASPTVFADTLHARRYLFFWRCNNPGNTRAGRLVAQTELWSAYRTRYT
jgi:hypothetical protein